MVDITRPAIPEKDQSVTAATASPAKRSPARKREWAPHFWEGCDAAAWLRLLVRNRFAVHWTKWYVAATASLVSPIHSAMRLPQMVLYGKRATRTRIENGPVFIIGHWRSGTTLLHELLIRDPRHAFPTTYECLVPHHFLLTRSWVPKLLWWMMPSHRPMDNMPVGWDRPQEDEFALCMLGQRSPYLKIAFPNRPADDGALDLGGLSPRQLARWKSSFLRFMRELTLANHGRRLILKSPPHTWRIPTLLELFPDARFVHIVRDPYSVYPSTLKLWKSLYMQQGLQRPTFAGLSDQVLNTFVAMHARLEETRKLIPAGRLVELRYEDLIRDPIAKLEMLYRELNLGEFEPAREQVETYVAGIKSYETNRHDLSPAERETVTKRWGHVIRRYGYSEVASAPVAAVNFPVPAMPLLPDISSAAQSRMT
jgi:omega-hydroxy-beta-dihydromenaquinone-9 sulfotransferase